MYYKTVATHLGFVALLIGGMMLLSLPWAFPVCGVAEQVEWPAVIGLGVTVAVSFLLAGILLFFGRETVHRFYRREALAVVGLSWIVATVLGALPFLISGTCRQPPLDEGSQPVRMTICDALFESASGFTGAGATVITDLEDPGLVPRAILFWRSETHFLGGLGILVLFVAVLGQGSAAKAVMRAEVPGPAMENAHARVQHSARAFAGIYVGLNAVLTSLLMLQGMSLFDALCHAFGTIATGGFSTWNASVAHFNSPGIDATITVFMAVSCINFTLLWLLAMGRPGEVFRDPELRAYAAILCGAILLTVAFGVAESDFGGFWSALRYSSFNVTSILTNTGFATQDFDQWNGFGRALLLVLMFVGGCAGSTSCSIKVIRYLILWRGLSSAVEKAFRPKVVRPVRLGGRPIDNQIIYDVYFYIALVAAVSAMAWLGLLFFESDEIWIARGLSPQNKLVDCASAVAATINGVGPGLGVVGATQNYAHLHACSKLICTALMLLGRLEFLPLLVLCVPAFWHRGT